MSTKRIVALAGAMVCVVAFAQAQDFTPTLKKFIGLLPAEVKAPGALKVGSWALGGAEPAGSKALYATSSRAKSLETRHEGATVTVLSLDGKICAIKAVWSVAKPDLKAAREAIIGKLGKTPEINTNFDGDVSFHYRSPDNALDLYLGTTSSELVLFPQVVKPYQELLKLKNGK